MVAQVKESPKTPTESFFLSLSEELTIAHGTYVPPDRSKKEPPRYASTKLLQPLNVALGHFAILHHHLEMAQTPHMSDVYSFTVSCLRDVFNQFDEHPITIEEVLELLNRMQGVLIRIRYAHCSSEDLLTAANFCSALHCYYHAIESDSEYELLSKATRSLTERAS